LSQRGGHCGGHRLLGFQQDYVLCSISLTFDGLTAHQIRSLVSVRCPRSALRAHHASPMVGGNGNWPDWSESDGVVRI
jgi:hypothetical protein